jgi:hypothetical protein
MAQETVDRSFSDLLSKIYCPICGSNLTINNESGKRSLSCRVHGEMKSYIDRADLAAAAQTSFCSGITKEAV